jgi:hypothetical protein
VDGYLELVGHNLPPLFVLQLSTKQMPLDVRHRQCGHFVGRFRAPHLFSPALSIWTAGFGAMDE